MRDVSWNFFYGIVNFDAVIGTMNHYGNVDLFAGRYNSAYRKAELDHQENFPPTILMGVFQAMLADWTNAGYDPFAAPQETGSPFGAKRGDNLDAITRTARHRRSHGRRARRREDPLRRQRLPDQPDVRRRRPVRARGARRARLRGRGRGVQPVRLPLAQSTSRGTRRWSRCARTACTARRPRSTSCRSSTATTGSNGSCSCPTRSRGTSRTANSGSVRSTVVMKAGDVAAMPADIRHQGYSSKRSMLLVWENGSPALPDLIAIRAGADRSRLASEAGARWPLRSIARRCDRHSRPRRRPVALEGFTHLIPFAAGARDHPPGTPRPDPDPDDARHRVRPDDRCRAAPAS